jgi:hypothetical protein
MTDPGEDPKPAKGRKKSARKGKPTGGAAACRAPLTKANALELIEHVACGGSVLAWCREKGVRDSTAYRMLERHQVAQEFARARATGAQALAEEALAIVDAADPTDPQDVARRKLRAETRLKLAACYAPAIYGLSKQAGASGGASVSVTIATGVPDGGTASRRITVEATDAATSQRLELADDDADG